MAHNNIANNVQVKRAIEKLELLDYRTIEQMPDDDIYSYLNGDIRNRIPELSATDKRTLAHATTTIKSGGNEAVKLLIEHSKRYTPTSSLYALSLLREIKNEIALPYLIDCVGNNAGFEFSKEATMALLEHGENAIQPIVERINDMVAGPEKYETDEYCVYPYYMGVLLKILSESEYDGLYELIDHVSNNIASLDVQSVLCNILSEIQGPRSINIICDIRNRFGYYIEIDEHTYGLIDGFNSKMKEEGKYDCLIENLEFPQDVRETFNILLNIQNMIREEAEVGKLPVLEELIASLAEKDDMEYYLAQLSEVDSQSVAYIACAMLGLRKTPDAMNILIDIIKDEKISQRAIVACAALAKMGEYALQEIISHMDYSIISRKHGDVTADNHLYLMPALSMMENESAFDYLISLIDILEDSDLSVLILNLEGTHNPAAIPHLEKLISRIGETDRIAIKAHGAINKIRTHDVLKSQDWIIYGCCECCKHSDEYGDWCDLYDKDTSDDEFCFTCSPSEAIDCTKCASCESDIFSFNEVNPINSSVVIDGDTMDISIYYTFDDNGIPSLNFDTESSESAIDFESDSDLLDFKNILQGKVDSIADGEIVSNGDGTVTANLSETMVFGKDIVEKMIPLTETLRFIFLTDAYVWHKKQYELNKGLDDDYSTDGDNNLNKGDGNQNPSKDKDISDCEHELEKMLERKQYDVFKCNLCGTVVKNWR